MSTEHDTHWMHHALELAQQAADNDEVPVGAVVVRNNELTGEGWNQPIASHDATAHAEIVAMREASSTLQNYRLTGSTLFVTLEPCPMCVGAMIHARVERLVFGASDPKIGAVGGAVNLLESKGFNHRIQAEGGLLAAESTALLQEFFRMRR